MIIRENCEACGAPISGEATPVPLERTGGQEGFLEYDFDCPSCGHNNEGVLRRQGDRAMRKGDTVHCKSMPNYPGKVIRVSEKGQWADVDWFSHSKRLGLQYLEVEP